MQPDNQRWPSGLNRAEEIFERIIISATILEGLRIIITLKRDFVRLDVNGLVRFVFPVCKYPPSIIGKPI